MDDEKTVEQKIKTILNKIVDEENPCGSGRIILMNRRYVLLSTDYFTYDLTKDLEELFNAAGDAVLYKGGEKIGRDLYKYYAPIAKEKGVDVFDLIAAVGWYYGWATGEIVEKGENNGVYRMILYHSFEADSFIAREGRTNKSVCHFLKGVLKGIVEEHTGWKYTASEPKCRAKGDELCEFVYKPLR
ncbi:MAG: hydrocarbon binding protein (contains V4R domain) [Euryarchaeota archaeon]|nr:hydrocarbon binding protein (contains V4R domain) [Euryarchaeota archaeon]